MKREKRNKESKPRLLFHDQKITSSNLNAFTYDSNDSKLIIEFKGGAKYMYHKVPAVVIKEFIQAESQGSFFHKFIKRNFEFEKVKHED